MRSLSLWQPWASAMEVGAKTIETRNRLTHVRGKIAIQAAKKTDNELRKAFEELCQDPWIFKCFKQAGLDDWGKLSFGCIVAVGTLYHCEPTLAFRAVYDLPPHEYELGNFTAGRFGWMFKDIRRLKMPVPCSGNRGFFTLPPDIESKVMDQL